MVSSDTIGTELEVGEGELDWKESCDILESGQVGTEAAFETEVGIMDVDDNNGSDEIDCEDWLDLGRNKD